LIEKGAGVNRSAGTPLIVSSQEGHLPVVQYLIENKANVNQANFDGTTALYASSFKGHLQVVQYLIQNGADVNQAAKNGISPLIAAIYNNHTEVAKFLVRNDADIGHTKLDLKKYGELGLIAILDKLYKEMGE